MRHTRRATRIKAIILVRESDQYDHELLAGMVDQTLRQHISVPGAKEALALRLQPFHDPDGHDATTIDTGGEGRAVAFYLKGTLFIYWAGSAAKEDRDRGNAFTSYLAKAVRTYRPEKLYSSTFSRLVRSKKYREVLRSALEASKTVVICSDARIDLGEPTGALIWELMVMITSAERDSIEARLTLGVIFAARERGRVPWGSLPPGYITDDEGRVRPSDDPKVIEMVRRMIEILAVGGRDRAVLHQLNEIGLRWRGTKKVSGAVPGIGESRDPKTVVQNLNRWLSVYESGEFHLKRTVPPGYQEFAGLPVQSPLDDAEAEGANFDDLSEEGLGTDAEGERGDCYVVLPMPWGAPPGGWHDPEVFDAWRTTLASRAERRTEDEGGHRQESKPLLGFPSWVDGPHRYKLLSNQRFRYTLRRRASSVTGGWEAEIGASDVVATIPVDLLHASIADGIVNALETGSALTLAETVSTGENGQTLPRDLVVKLDPESRADALRNRLVETRAAASRAQDVAYLAKHPDGVRDAVALAEQRREEADALELQLQELEASIRDKRQTPPPVSLVVDPGAVLAALANLKACQHLTPRKVRDALHGVLRNFRIRIEGDVARWKLDVDLPGRGHLITLEGVSGTCPLATQGDWALDDRSLRRRRAFIAERLGEGDGLAGLVEHPPHSWASWQYAAHTVVPVGRPYRHLVKAALVHPVRETRQLAAVAAYGSELPDLPGWAALLDEAWRGMNWIPRDLYAFNCRVNEMLEWVEREGGSVSWQAVSARYSGRHRLPVDKFGRSRRGRTKFTVFDVDQSEENRLLSPRCPDCSDAPVRAIYTPEVQLVACVNCCRPLTGHRDRLPSGYFDLCDETVWATVLGPIAGTAARDPSYRALIEALPDIPFTRAELRDRAMVPQGSMGVLMDRIIEEGRVVDLNAFDPRATGAGMRPKLYALPTADAAGWIAKWREESSK